MPKFLVFKSCRGLDRPWLVFSPSERLHPSEETWSKGFSTWKEAIESIGNQFNKIEEIERYLYQEDGLPLMKLGTEVD